MAFKKMSSIFLLNVKGIVFKLHGRGQVQLTLKKSGAGAVVAGDIELPHDVEILNPEHIICHLAENGQIVDGNQS